ncbi:MAG: cytochrome C biogenesis protein [Chitinophagia bacterium]|nr:cytochrome C biogenesis protein [Chitinophagia bacterium]
MNTSKQIFALLKKDLLLETRQQHTLYGILLYIASTIFVVYLTIDLPDADTWNAIFWITQLFICINAVAKSFLQESRGRMLYYFTITSPVAFILSKLLYNLLLMVVMSSVNLIVYSAMMGNPTISFFSFCLIGILGGCGLGLIFTMLAAIASKAMQQASLMAILGFPLILPQLMMLVRLSKTAFGEIFNNGIPFQMTLLLVSFDILMIILAVILFPFLWKD